ncbi:MAG: hypothetical protein KAI66_00940 [Lentisphaeria bacterium]|nr:hypothetical protein [Lentisphaeria bacterium]
MSKAAWLGLNLVLACVALGVTHFVLGYDPSGDWRNREEKTKTRVVAGRRTMPVATDTATNVTRDIMGPASMDTLWKQSLFRPDRTEEEKKENEGANAAAKPALPPVDMELLGTAKIADRQVAIIIVKKKGRSRPVRRVRGRPVKLPPAEEVGDDTDKRDPKRHIKRVGDEVGSTGYIVKEIHFGEVMLTRGDEELVLRIQTDDASSLKRREAAAKAAPKPVAGGRVGTISPAAAGKIGSPPPPPPAPGVVATPANTASSQTSRVDRLKKAAELRRRIMEKSRKSSSHK